MDSSSEPKQCIGIDGYTRSIAMEQELNSLAASTFVQPGAQKFLEYLRGITLNAIVPPGASNEVLREQEGMRRLFSIIQQRINKGKEGPNGGRGEAGGPAATAAGRRKPTAITRQRGRKNPA